MISVLLRVFLFWLKGGGTLMVDVYVALIINGRRTFSQVPTILQPAVEAELAALGLGSDGKPLNTAA
jgi:hypothetical protein